MKRLGALALAVGIAIGLTGCGGSSSDDPGASNGLWVDTGDGRTVYCIGVGQGMSCDWENADR